MIGWLNGELGEKAHLDATSAGALFGWGVFTTVGIRGGSLLLFERHCARLRRDAQAACIPLEWSDAALDEGLNAVLRANAVQQGIARLTLLRRDDGRWNTEAGSDLLILAHPGDGPPISSARVVVSPYRVTAERPLPGVKTTSYLPYLLAWQEARAGGYDEALLLTTEGFLCEGARTTLFWMRDGEIYTPELTLGALAGVGREWVLAWAQSQGIIVHQGRFRHAPDLGQATEAFLISAASGPRPIASIFAPESQQEYAFDVPGPLTSALIAVWSQLVS